MTANQTFAFEADFVASLRCIPMAVRFKLDRCGVKLSLRQWSRFTPADRRSLLNASCETDGEVTAYRDALVELVDRRAHEVAKPLAVAPCGSWEDKSGPPGVVVDYARAVGLQPPGPADWAALSELQRFVLVKLTRDNHDNINFAPAMREFGLADSAPPRRRSGQSATSRLAI